MTTSDTPRLPNDELPAFLRFIVAKDPEDTEYAATEECASWNALFTELADTLERDPHHTLGMMAVRAMTLDDPADRETAGLYAEFAAAGRPGFTPRPQVIHDGQRGYQNSGAPLVSADGALAVEWSER